MSREITDKLTETLTLLRASKLTGYPQCDIEIAIQAYEIAVMLSKQCESFEDAQKRSAETTQRQLERLKLELEVVEGGRFYGRR